MFNKLRRNIFNWLSESDNHDQKGLSRKRPYKSAMPAELVCSDSEYSGMDGRNWQFKVFPGQGGVAIETITYDERLSKNIIVMHVVPEGNDLSEALSQIITMQALRG